MIKSNNILIIIKLIDKYPRIFLLISMIINIILFRLLSLEENKYAMFIETVLFLGNLISPLLIGVHIFNEESNTNNNEEKAE